MLCEHTDIFLKQIIQFYFNNTIRNSTHHVVLYPQNGDRIATIDSVTSIHPMCTSLRVSLLAVKSVKSRRLFSVYETAC